MYNLTKKPHIHFVGIGGIGMSGIATILHAQGYTISGCDVELDQPSIRNLQKLGCAVYHGNNTIECHDSSIDILVYSSAIRANNPEIIRAQQRNIPTIERALMLAELMRTKYSIAIAGSHGKTTTTSLISHILIEAEFDPTVIIGGNLKTISHNARIGKGDFLVAEADESDRSFLHLHTTLAVVTNIDLEHLETYSDLNDIKQTFTHFLSNLPFYGKAIVCIDDPNIQAILPIAHVKTIHYGLSTQADVYAKNIQLYPDHCIFDVHTQEGPHALGTVHFSMPGEHNILNALGACALALDLEIPFATIAHALSTFKGVERRFSYRGIYNGADVFDDYGHHPNEIMHTLKTAKKRAHNKLTVVFQPHRYTRTKYLWDQFLQVFMESSVDNLIITDIYPASECPIPHITSELFVQALLKQSPSFHVAYVPYDHIINYINVPSMVEQGDLVLLLGAGKVNQLAHELTLCKQVNQ